MFGDVRYAMQPTILVINVDIRHIMRLMKATVMAISVIYNVKYTTRGSQPVQVILKSKTTLMTRNVNGEDWLPSSDKLQPPEHMLHH